MDDASFFDAVYEEVRRRAIEAMVVEGIIPADEADDWQPILPACSCLAPMCDCPSFEYVHCSKCKTRGVLRDGTDPE